ncbi:exosortase-dependent surface protein XDP1 [Neptunicella sp. SCSIO 80796]|uniref:exosortase-dependent surface protein XDP1 n=1 Tax=Neptunicella plasticusilytica TaxID=3117012 RepID=UPI003A4E3037
MLKSSLLLITGLLSMQALAGTQTWDMDDSPLYGGSNDGNYLNLTEDSITLTVTGWSDTGGSNDDIIASGELAFYGSGELGLINRDEGDQQPDHSIDSSNSNSNNWVDYDAVLLEFSQAVNLEQFYVGWAYDNGNSEADISLLAYTNHSGNGTADIEGSSWNNIIGQGWESIDNYANVDDYSYQIVDTTVTSKYWLIGAYNPIFGSGSGLGSENDGFKLKEVYTSTSAPRTEVPEPNALAILAIGLLSLVRVRSRNKQI